MIRSLQNAKARVHSRWRNVNRLGDILVKEAFTNYWEVAEHCVQDVLLHIELLTEGLEVQPAAILGSGELELLGGKHQRGK